MALLDWIADSVLDRPSHWWARCTAAGLITILSILVVAVLWRRMGVIADPGLILLFTVAAATYLAGGMAGMLSAAIVLFCSIVLFSHPLYPFRYSEMDWRQMMVIIVACPVIALMVGSLKEQVDRLKIVTKEAQALRDEVRRFETVKQALFTCEQSFHLMAECATDYAICVLDANGSVKNWNAGAERLLGYSDPEIVGQSYSRFFIREDLLGKQPERLLGQVRFSGRAVEEGWRLRKGGGRFRARTSLLSMKNADGTPSGCLLVIQDLTHPTEIQEPSVRG
jgi:PAS domain S-box-containing protein